MPEWVKRTKAVTSARWERLRWRIAYLLGRLRGQCWADLVSWALNGPRFERRMDRSPLPWRPVGRVVGGSSCQLDAARIGTCYCGKFRDQVSAGARVGEGRTRSGGPVVEVPPGGDPK